MLVDTHCHLDQDDFQADRAEVIARATDQGVEAIVSVGISAASSRATVQIARQFPGVFAAVGIHPNECAKAAPDDWGTVTGLVEDSHVVALGETGLDCYWNEAPLPLQQDFFDRHLRLAQQRGLPVVIHTRDSQEEALAMLREARTRGPLSGVMHSFTGTAEQAAECQELGLHISFAGMVTFKKSDDLRAVAAAIRADRLLVETDSPYLAPHPLRGRRNEPANVIHTARCLAEVRGVALETLAAQTTANARRLFRLP